MKLEQNFAKKKQNHKSLQEKIWQQKQINQQLFVQLMSELNLSEFQAQILSAKFAKLAECKNFLEPKLKNLMPDPFSIIDMQKGAEFIAKAIISQKKIAIFGDYDVDGATSSALLKNFFAHHSIDARIYIPDRILEGYGPNIKALKQLKDEGHDLVITVDCGTTAIDPLEQAAKYNLDIIVVDHHISKNLKPEAVAVINPNRDDDESELKYLAGVGVCFMLLVAVNKILRESNYYQEKRIKEANLIELLDLVALGTVCDCVPLIGLNRALVKQGLKVLNNSKNLGLNYLFELCSLTNKEIEEFHLGFIIGPRINAAGRVGKSSLGAELLSLNEQNRIANISEKLEIYNRERKTIEAIVLEEATAQIEENNLSDDPVIICAGTDWHPGVIGIVASRIKEKYNKPVIIIAIDQALGKASCRSIANVNIGEIITQAKNANVITEGGGHAMAAGFSILADRINDLRAFINNNFNDLITKTIANQIAEYDYICSLEKINKDFWQEIRSLKPYGMQNDEPCFLLPNIKIMNVKIIAEKHLKLNIGEFYAGKFTNFFEALCWNIIGTEFAAKLLNMSGQSVSLIAKIKENTWQDKTKYQLELIDVIESTN